MDTVRRFSGLISVVIIILRRTSAKCFSNFQFSTFQMLNANANCFPRFTFLTVNQRRSWPYCLTFMTLFLLSKKRRVAFVSPFCVGLLASACGSPAQKIEKHLAIIWAPISATLLYCLLLHRYTSYCYRIQRKLSKGDIFLLHFQEKTSSSSGKQTRWYKRDQRPSDHNDHFPHVRSHFAL